MAAQKVRAENNLKNILAQCQCFTNEDTEITTVYGIFFGRGNFFNEKVYRKSLYLFLMSQINLITVCEYLYDTLQMPLF